MWLIVLAGFTDLLDGVVARATGADTRMGQLLDPVADKVLLSGVFVGLAWIGSVPLWLVGIVFGRDVLLILSSLFAMLFTTYSNLKPNLLGKTSTAFQILTAGIFIAANALGGAPLHTLGIAFIWPTALLACLSAAVYAWRASRYFHDPAAPR